MRPTSSSKGESMPKSNTHFPQVPVEIAEKVAELEMPIDLTQPPEGTGKRSKDQARPKDDLDDLLDFTNL
jgi:hypothetical protein